MKVLVDRKKESRYMFDEALMDVKLEYIWEEIEKSDSWRDADISFMVDKLQEEIGEFLVSMKIDDNLVEQKKELLDVANVATMLYSKIDYLNRERNGFE